MKAEDVRLAELRELEQVLVSDLYRTPPDREEIVRVFKSHERFNPDEEYDFGVYRKNFSEIGLELKLRELTDKHPELNISLDAFGNGKETEGYFYHQEEYGRFFVCKKIRPDNKFRDTAYEYDNLFISGNTPVVFEMKMANWHSNPGNRGEGIKNHMKSKIYQKRLLPICQLFKNPEAGYVMVIPKDTYDQQEGLDLPEFEKQASIYEKFKRNNGIIVPTNLGILAFNEEVYKMVEEFGLKLKQVEES